jgi:hypothetical protein
MLDRFAGQTVSSLGLLGSSGARPFLFYESPGL